MSNLQETRDRLAEHDATYQRLRAKHQSYERRLVELRDCLYLSENEKIEEVRLKKLKLAIKDRMEELVRQASAR